MLPISILVCVLCLVRLCEGSFSPHPAITKISKWSQNFSPSARVSWYLPEYGFGDYSNTTHLYTCRYTDSPHEFIYNYSLVLSLEPEFAKIYYSTEVGGLPEGNVCFQVCTVFDGSIEKCSEPFKLANKANDSQPQSYPVFWDQNKKFNKYPHILKLEGTEAGILIEWYFPEFQAEVFPITLFYTCEFDPETLSVSNKEFEKEVETKQQNIHNATIAVTSTRWGCVIICVASRFYLCGEPARFDSLVLRAPNSQAPAPYAPTPSQGVSRYFSNGTSGRIGFDGYDLVFDDYEDYDSLYEESEPRKVALGEDVSDNSTSSDTSHAPPLLPNLLSVILISLVLAACVIV